MVTPFNGDGSVDLRGLENLIEYLIDGRVEYLVSLGTTGETATLSKEEKETVFKFTAEKVAGRVPLVAGIGGNNTFEVAKTIESFNAKGYDAILSVSPYYNKPTQGGIYQHYRTIALASPLPVILYNVPSRTGSCISAETTLRLAHDVKNIIATKEASADFNIFSEILRDKPEDFFIISGDDALTLPMIALGAAGIISVAGNVAPKVLAKMTRLCLEGKFKEAKTLNLKLINLINLCFTEGSPAGAKTALKVLGICGNTVRLPLVKGSLRLHQDLENELRELELQVQV